MKISLKVLNLLFCLVVFTAQLSLHAQNEIEKIKKENHYLPDFSFAGYHNGEIKIPRLKVKIFYASDYGVIANDGKDDTKALVKAIKEISDVEGYVILQLPVGQIIISDIIYIERSNFVLRGAGSGKEGTEIYCPRPLMYAKDPKPLKELREYLLEFDKRQLEKENNIDLAFSQYSWSGGFIWTQYQGERVKSYLQSYDQPHTILAKINSGKRGEFRLKANNIKNLNVGDVVELQLFNKDGKNGEIIKDLYKDEAVKVGGHHWNFPDLPIVRQQVEIKAIKGKNIILNTPLTIAIKPEYEAQLVEWKHLKEVGIEHLSFRFPKAPRIAHHVESGYNAIYLTRVYNSWVKDVVIKNAESGIISEHIANVTMKDITTKGDNYAHYTLMMQGTYNVLASGIKVYNKSEHPLSFNTFATKSVYTDCEVFIDPILDQHSGANHQNLFDDIKVHVAPKENGTYPLFKGGGAGYWKPSHGAYSTFWNIQVYFLEGLQNQEPILLNGMKDGVRANVVGVSGNHQIKVIYKPNAYISSINQAPKINSLYYYQLQKRLLD